MSYVQGFVIPVPEGKKEAYRKMAEQAAPFFKEYGATRIVECWGADLMRGKRTDFYRAVDAQEGENVVFSWIEWPSREVCDAAAAKMESDKRMQPPADMPFDGKRMIYSGFEVMLDE